MNLLFVANRFPFPPHRGDKIKVYNLAKKLSKKHKLTLVTFTIDEKDKSNINELKGIFSRIETVHLPQWKSFLSSMRFLFDASPVQVLYFRSNEFRKLLDKVVLEEKPDAVHIQHLRMSQYLPQLHGIPAILDLPDAFSMYWERRAKEADSFFRKQFNKMEFKRVVKYESILKEFNLVTACSTEDVNYLKKRHSIENIKMFPNGVNTKTFSQEGGHNYEQNIELLFTGNMNYAPNVDGVNYFVKDIFPLILEKHPNAKFIIAGQKPVASVKALASENVVVTGFVESIADYYKRASVVVASLRIGAGTQNKVLEAMSMGVPVVCTNIGFEGLGIKSGEGAFMETEPNAFAERINQLLADKNLREATGKKGIEVVKSKFDWDVIAGMLEGYFNDITI